MITAIKNDERIIFALRSLYGQYGYGQYKMSKFEEYDLYVRNKDFLISDSIITFTDTNGKLMALKPDVTLSIVKNSRDVPGCVQKVYYNENVYRVSRGTRSFKEIMQVGLECIGDIDDFSILEVLELAARSLKEISPRSVLNISHLGVVSSLLEGVNPADRRQILHCIQEKNAHELAQVCEGADLGDRATLLNSLLASYGTPAQVIPALKRQISSPALDQLEMLSAALPAELRDMLRIDFSVVSDVSYYNGVVFKGYVEGVPQGVLSGGQYDRLMAKMGRRSGAIGFAVYLDQLERLHESDKKYDVDVLLLYDGGADLPGLQRAVAQLRADGSSVTAQRQIPEKLRWRRLAEYRNGEVKILENA